ncbi:MAG: hypothetical protein NT062_34210 [Proteobacteria bacterium]|nr:hypothetical protein [Pseudomonadota bacterium]
MRSAWLVGPLLISPALSPFLAVTAHAEEKTLHATLAGDVAATDNVFAVAGDANVPREADVYAQLRPGLLFGWASPRATYTGAIEGEVLQYARHSDQPSLTFRTAVHAAWVLSPDSDLSVGATGSTGKLNAIANRTTPDMTIVTAAPPGDTSVLQGDGTQTFGTSLARTVRFTQSLLARYVQTTDPVGAETRAGDVGALLGVDKSLDGDAITIDAGVNYVRLARYAPGTATTPMTGSVERTLGPRVNLGWRHDLSQRWSTGVSGGIAWLIPIGTDDYTGMPSLGTTVAPVFGANLSYVEQWGYANLAYAHTLQPNLLIAQNTQNDALNATLSVPLVWLEESRGRVPRFVASGNASAARTALIQSETAQPQGTYYVGRIDLGVAYAMRPDMTFALRYALTHQVGQDADPLAMVAALPSFTTNTLTLTFNLRYPATSPVVGKKQKSVRADGSDLTQPAAGSDDELGVGGNVTPAR